MKEDDKELRVVLAPGELSETDRLLNAALETEQDDGLEYGGYRDEALAWRTLCMRLHEGAPLPSYWEAARGPVTAAPDRFRELAAEWRRDAEGWDPNGYECLNRAAQDLEDLLGGEPAPRRLLRSERTEVPLCS